MRMYRAHVRLRRDRCMSRNTITMEMTDVASSRANAKETVLLWGYQIQYSRS
jgi:hypothetical protein